MSHKMESSIDSNSSKNSNHYNEVYEDFRRQALDFYGSEHSQNLLSTDVEKCLKKRADAFINKERKSLFLFPCINDLSNVPEDDEEPSIPQKCLESLFGSKVKVSLSRRSSDAESTNSSEIKDLSSIVQSKQALFRKNQESF
ncbi:hypothetical protein ABPG72_016312 [Tetrahymena utriculariae]